ncbi:branched-chain amino acid ABC transporter permease [Nitratireductor indicus C115]|uniref:Branched-chain amino acid ABC transporter permease n=1 Tax=Nitratireductor indicus C115 TaxID=1231190 RepID=K2PM83_9HYPH|nr:urea ABC transporter permease subunit UrtC [Nitratireductor indicus]EKF42182.1 branched-chain amino acid ABC transporter permease [Nitratireductor indicus C115]SFQ61330.1 urea transport system permease protein [Nitratireductor indicus]
MNLTGKSAQQTLLYGAFCVAILLVPLFLDDAFLLNKYSRYLVFAMLAVALSLSWGYAGILNLGQATTFGLGSYCMAMALKLGTVPVHTGSDGLPDFMVWNNVTELPWFWAPFHSMAFALMAGILVPAAFAALLGWFMFRGRITGVYAAIITLAAMVVVNLVIIDQQRFTGGFNGITDLAQFEVAGLAFDAYSSSTYYLVAFCLSAVLLLSLAITRSKTGMILQAIRDQEDRVRFFGYDVALYKIFVFAVSAGIAGLAGMLYTIVMEFASPTFLGVPLSLSVVIWVAVGGRQSLLGAAIGALIVTGVQGALSESETFLESWMLIMGGLFVLVVLFLPKGIAGAFEMLAALFLRRSAAKVPSVSQPAGEAITHGEGAS